MAAAVAKPSVTFATVRDAPNSFQRERFPGEKTAFGLQACVEIQAGRAERERKAAGSIAIFYFVAQRYTEALQGIGSAQNQKVVMLLLEASSLIGSLAGIGEIARTTLQRPSGKTSAPDGPA